MISNGNYTVGAGGDYSTWTLAAAAIASVLTGDLTFTQIANTDETGVYIFFPAIDISGHTLLFTCAVPHAGSPIASFVSIVGLMYFGALTDSGSGHVEMEDVFWRSTVNNAVLYDSPVPLTLCKSLFKSSQVGPSAFSYHNAASGLISVSGCKFWAPSTGLYIGNDGPVIQIENSIALTTVGFGTASFVINSIHASGVGSFMRNCIGFTTVPSNSRGIGGIAYASLPQDKTATSAGNAATGATYTDIPQAGNLLSVTDTDPDFLNTDPASSLFTLGSAPALPCNSYSAPYPIGYALASVPVPLSVPVLLAPPDASSHITGCPLLVWTAVTDAAYYEVHVATDLAFSDRVARIDTLETMIERGFPFGDTYYWKVRAIAAGGAFSDFSETWSFTVPPIVPGQVGSHLTDGQGRLSTQFKEST